MIISVVLIHHRIVLSEEEHVATHWISKSLERGEISNVVMIGFENCGHAVLAHQRLRTIHALGSHALRIEALLPIGHFRTKSELRRILDHKRPPTGQILVARPYPERNIASTTVCSSTERINGVNMTVRPMSSK